MLSLESIRELDAEIIAIEERLHNLIFQRDSYMRRLDGLPRSINYSSRVERIATAIADCELDLESLRGERADCELQLREEIFARVEGTPAQVLAMYYCDCLSLAEISKVTSYAKSTVHRLREVGKKRFESRD